MNNSTIPRFVVVRQDDKEAKLETDSSYAEFLGQLAGGMTHLAKLKGIMDGERGDFGKEVKATLITAQDSVNRLVDLLNEAQRLVRAREEKMKEEARRQGILPLFDDDVTVTFGSKPSDNNPADAPGAASTAASPIRWEVVEHSERGERYAVQIGLGEDGQEEVIVGYVEIPREGDLPVGETLPGLQYMAEPRALEFLNAQLEPWARLVDWVAKPPAPESTPKEPKAKRKNAPKVKVKGRAKAADHLA